MFWRVCQLYWANHYCSQLIPGMFWTKQHGLHSCAPERVWQCAADEPRDIFTPPSSELENRFVRVPTSVFQPARFSWYFSFRSQFLHSRFIPVVACRTGIIFGCFAGTTGKRQESEDFELGTVSQIQSNTAIWHVEIALVFENSDLSYLHVLMHVITVGDVRCNWLMHQSIPAAPIPPWATAGHLHTLSVPGVGN